MPLFKNKNGEPRKFNFLNGVSPKLSFVLGMIAGIAVFSALSFFLLYGVFLKTVQMQNAALLAGSQQPTPAAEQPAEPTVDASKLSPVTKDSHVRGNFDAPVTLILFTDFQCPYCANHHDTIKQIVEDYQGKVRLVLRHFPLSFHDQALNAAEASECADEQGKFWEMHDQLFDMNKAGTMSVENFKKAAADLKLNTEQFDKCLDGTKYAAKIQSDYQEGLDAGVQGTPATFVNGQLVVGAVPYADFKSIIDGELKK